MFVRLLLSFIKIFFILFAVFVLYRAIRFYLFFKGAVSGAQQFKAGQKKRETASLQTIKCAQCDTYVADELSVSGRFAGETLNFCSEECKNAYSKK